MKKCRERALETKAFSDFSSLLEILREKTGIDDIITHDGSMIRMSNNTLGLENYYIHDPALKLHASVSLTSFTTIYNNLTAGQADERTNISDDEKPLTNKLVICDAGYCSDNVYEQVEAAGGYFLIKLRANCGFQIEAMQKVSASEQVVEPVVPLVKGKKVPRALKVTEVKVSDELAADLIATTQSGIRLRVVKFKIEKDGNTSTISLATNIPADKLDLFQIAAIYRARWQVEIFYRCMKGFCSMKGSRSSNLNIQKAFMLFSLITAYLKIILGATAQENSGNPLEISPKKLMHSISPYLDSLISKIIAGNKFADILKQIRLCCREITVTMKKSKPSFINRKRGKYIGWIIENIKRPIIKNYGSHMGKRSQGGYQRRIRNGILLMVTICLSNSACDSSHFLGGVVIGFDHFVQLLDCVSC